MKKRIRRKKLRNLHKTIDSLKAKRLFRLLMRGFNKQMVHEYTGWSRVTIDKYMKVIEKHVYQD